MPHASSNPSISSALPTTPTRPPLASAAITDCCGSDNSPASAFDLDQIGTPLPEHEGIGNARDNAPPDASARRNAGISRMVHAPPHHAVTRDLAGRCDLETQRIGDLPLQRMLGHRRAVGYANAITPRMTR